MITVSEGILCTIFFLTKLTWFSILGPCEGNPMFFNLDGLVLKLKSQIGGTFLSTCACS